MILRSSILKGMNILRDSNSDEVILEWLKAEFNSERFRNDLIKSITDLGFGESIITNSQPDDKSENIARRKILYRYRDWLDEDLNEYDWQLVDLSSEEVGDLNYIDYSYWNELSDGTQKVNRAVKAIENGRTVFDVSNDGFHSIATSVINGVELPPIIVITKDNSPTCRIIEGHLRATGFVLSHSKGVFLRALWGRKR